jgi:hypothetical protein
VITSTEPGASFIIFSVMVAVTTMSSILELFSWAGVSPETAISGISSAKQIQVTTNIFFIIFPNQNP